MGANGSFSKGTTRTEEERMYETVYMIGDNIAVLEQKDKRKGTKLPEESHTPNRYYVAFRKDGKDVKSIAKYGADGKKIWEIHTNEHNGIIPHFHHWRGNGQEQEGFPLTQEMLDLLRKIRNLNKPTI